MNRSFSQKGALAIATLASLILLLIAIRLFVGENGEPDELTSPSAQLPETTAAPSASGSASIVSTQENRATTPNLPSWFESISEEIRYQAEESTGPYRIETVIAQTSFHRPLLRLDRTFYGSGHRSESELLSERISVANEFIVAPKRVSS